MLSDIKLTVTAVFLLLCSSSFSQNVTVYGSTGIVNGTGYSTLNQAFAAINAQATHTGDRIEVRINASTTETTTAILNQPTGSSWTSLKIYPTSAGLVVSGAIAANPLITFNGADKVQVTGSVNGQGASKDITFHNTSSTGKGTFWFTADACNSAIKNCVIKGTSSTSSEGIVYFTVPSTTGNDNDTISNCSITSGSGGRPTFGLMSKGTATGNENDGLVVSDNYIYDVMGIGTGTLSGAIFINNYTLGVKITGNSIYETTPVAITPTNILVVMGIEINSTVGNTQAGHVISGNYIGGSGPNCTGTMDITVNTISSYTGSFYGIFMNSSTTSPTSLQGNTLANIKFTTPTNGGTFYGVLFNVSCTGVFNFGTTTGNTIGSLTSNNSIVFNDKKTAGGDSFSAIYYNPSSTGDNAFYCSNNNFGGLTVNSASSAVATSLYVINKTQPKSSAYITNNTIGGNLSNSIYASSIATNGTNHAVGAIYISGSLNTTVTNNSIMNMTDACNYYTASAGTMGCHAIYLGSSSGTVDISGNSIKNISASFSHTGSGGNQTMFGIYDGAVTSGNAHTIKYNTIGNIINSSSTFGGYISGIYYAGDNTASTNSLSSNFIYNLISSGIISSNRIIAIDIKAGVQSQTVVVANNIISLSSPLDHAFSGIVDEMLSSSSVSNLFHNTVYMGGSVVLANASTQSSAIMSQTSHIRNYQNNILANFRTYSSTSSAFSWGIYHSNPVSSNLTEDFNDYWIPVTGNTTRAYLGVFATTLSTLTQLQSATGKDANSRSSNPNFYNAGGTNASDYLTSTTYPLNGSNATGITTDLNGNARAATPNIGALELLKWKGSSNTNFGTASNWNGALVLPSGWSLLFDSAPANHCYLDQNRSMQDITSSQNTYKLNANGYQLSVAGTLSFTNGAQIDATTGGSVVTFSGSSPQTINSGAFVNNLVDGLTISNTSGVALGGNLTIAQTLNLSSGALSIGNNTLTLNGAIASTSGTLTGGSTSSINVGGSSPSLTLPSITLGNLTLNRASGINVGGNLTINGALTLSSGILAVNANTLTLAGTITSMTGSIDASNSSSNLQFTNNSVITFPTSLFRGSVNNLSTSGSGGIVLSDNLNVNGNLTIGTNSSLTIPAGVNLSVGGTLANFRGNYGLTLKGGAGGNGSLIHTAGSVAATVQTQMDRGVWRLISPPVSGQNISTFYSPVNSDIAVASPYYAFRYYNESNNQWSNYFTSDSINTYGNLVSGKGYAARRATLANAAFPAQDYVTYSGAVQNGVVNATVKRSASNKGWNCIGNPYTAPIALNSSANAVNNFITQNAASLDPNFGGIYTWDNDIQYRPITNAYRLCYVPIGAGFMVRVRTGTQSLQFTPQMRINSADITFRDARDDWHGFEVNLKSARGNLHTGIRLNAAMTDGLDVSYDAGLMRVNSGLALFSRLIQDNGVDFSLQCLADSFQISKRIPLGLDYDQTGTVSFYLSEVNLPEGISVYLDDLVSGVSTPLDSVSQTNITLASPISGIGRFYIRLVRDGASGISQEKLSVQVYAENHTLHYLNTTNKTQSIELISPDGHVCMKTVCQPFSKGSTDLNKISSKGVLMVRCISDKTVLVKKIINFI